MVGIVPNDPISRKQHASQQMYTDPSHLYALLLTFYQTYDISVTIQAVSFINRVDSRLAPSQ